MPASAHNQPRWNTRVWVAQEATLARRVVLLWGSSKLQWDDPWNKDDFTIFDQLFDGNGYTTALINQFRRFENLARPNVDLFNALSWTSGMQAKDTRDLIYGILGLVSVADSALISPDYEMSVAEVFAKATFVCIRRGRFEILFWPAPGCKYTERSNVLDVPSWAVDFTVDTRHFAKLKFLPPIPNPSVSLDLAGVLCIEGCAFDEVVTIEPNGAMHKELFKFDDTSDQERRKAFSLLWQDLGQLQHQKDRFNGLASTLCNATPHPYWCLESPGQVYMDPFGSEENKLWIYSCQRWIKKRICAADVVSYLLTSHGFMGETPCPISEGDILLDLGFHYMPILRLPIEGGEYKFVGMAFIWFSEPTWKHWKGRMHLAALDWEVFDDMESFEKGSERYVAMLEEPYKGDDGQLDEYCRTLIPVRSYWEGWELESLRTAKREYEVRRRVFRIK
jgi:hypothetical protein